MLCRELSFTVTTTRIYLNTLCEIIQNFLLLQQTVCCIYWALKVVEYLGLWNKCILRLRAKKNLKLNTARLFSRLSIINSCIWITAFRRAETAPPKNYVRMDIKVTIILRTKFPQTRFFKICFNVIQPSSRQRHYITPKRRNNRITLKYAEHPIRLSYHKSKILNEHVKISMNNF